MKEYTLGRAVDKPNHIQEYLHENHEQINVRDFLEDDNQPEEFEDGDRPRYFKNQTIENSIETTAPTM